MHAVFTDRQLADLGDKKNKNTVYARIFGVRISARNGKFVPKLKISKLPIFFLNF